MSPGAEGILEDERRTRALVACGLAPELSMTRGASGANEVWLGDELVLRVNSSGVGRLAREGRIASRLPREALYPEIIAVGDDGELEWMLTRRAPGIDLGRAWAGMTTSLRERAIHEVAAALAAVHAAPCDGIPDDVRGPHALRLDEILATIERVRALGGEPQVLDEISALVRAKWTAFDAADRGLVHGDPHFENVSWDGAHVSALLDLEWSRPSWIHADLEILLSLAEAPALFAAPDYAERIRPAGYREIPRWLASTQPQWFAHPRLGDRLDVLRVSRTLGLLAETPTAEVRWRHLRAVVSGAQAILWTGRTGGGGPAR